MTERARVARNVTWTPVVRTERTAGLRRFPSHYIADLAMIPRPTALMLAMSVAIPLSSSSAQRPSTPTHDFPVIAQFDDDRFAWGSISPDGRFLLSGNDSIMIKVVKTGRVTKLANGGGYGLVWSSHMNRIAWQRLGDGASDSNTSFVWSIPLDSATGTSRGTPQRVSSGSAIFPGISADGAMIAYFTDSPRVPGRAADAAPYRLVAVDANGGPERVLANAQSPIDIPWWSRDGQSIYVTGPLAGGARAVINKTFLDGRTPQVIRVGDDEWFAGMTPDRTRLITVPAGSLVATGARAVVMDTTGQELWTVPLPDGATAIYDGPVGDSTLVWTNKTHSTALVVRALDGGRLRRIPLLGESNSLPKWSPDGRRISFLVRRGPRIDLAVINADGSNVQHFPGTDVRKQGVIVSWSPDSRTLGYVNRTGSAFRVLDLATGTSRTVFSDTTIRLGGFAWSPSGTSIMVFMNRQRSGGSSLELLSLNGTHRRIIANVGLPGAALNRHTAFLTDASLVVRSDAGVHLISSASPEPRKVVSLGQFVPSSAIGTSPDRKWMAVQIRSGSAPTVQLEITSLTTGVRRLSTLPFSFVENGVAEFTPDGRGVLLKGRQMSDSSGMNLYLASTTGAAAQFIANLGNPNAAGFSLSPNGKTLVHTVHEKSTSTLMAIDIRKPRR